MASMSVSIKSPASGCLAGVLSGSLCRCTFNLNYASLEGVYFVSSVLLVSTIHCCS